MPRINNAFLEIVFYLYPTRDAAERGVDVGGTGFIVGVPSKRIKDYNYLYGISNRHVVHDGGSSYVRVNMHSGGIDLFEIEPIEWTCHPGGDDLAVTLLLIDPTIHKIKMIPESIFITSDIVDQKDFGPGDDVFMVGRFIRHDGRVTNAPSVRFGNLSMRTMQISHPSRGAQESFAVEMRSMCGYSGSPVFIYHYEYYMTVVPQQRSWLGMKDLFLLGVDWGHIVEHWEVKQKIVPVRLQAMAEHEREVDYVMANTGMNGVVPAWKISELLHTAEMEQQRTAIDEELIERAAAKKGDIILEVLPLKDKFDTVHE